MNKLLLIIFLFYAQYVFAEDVGRVKLNLPQGTWITISTVDTAMAYGDDIAGTIKAETTARALIDKD